MLAKRLPQYADAIAPCIKTPISDKEYVAYTSAAYNFGSAGFCRSTIAKRLAAGDRRGACDALMQWVHAQGRVVKGLVNRRTAERKLCLEGVNEPAVKRVPVAPKVPEPKKIELTLWQKLGVLARYLAA
jgi:lysozyme